MTRCTCGRAYDHWQWLRLPLVGIQHIDLDDGEPAMLLELRNCACRSTVSRDFYAELATVARGEKRLATIQDSVARRAAAALDTNTTRELAEQLVAQGEFSEWARTA